MGRIPTKIGGNGKPISHLWEVHKEIARLQVSGMRPMDICKKLHYSPSWLSTIQNSPVYQKYLSTLSARADNEAIDIKKRITEGAELGVVELVKMVKGDGDYKASVPVSLKAKIAQDFLDRDGYGKIQKVQSTGTMVILNADKIAELKANRERLLKNLHDPVTQLPEQSVSNGVGPSPILDAEIV